MVDREVRGRLRLGQAQVDDLALPTLGVDGQEPNASGRRLPAPPLVHVTRFSDDRLYSGIRQ